MGNTVLFGVPLNTKSYLPTWTAMNDAIKEQFEKCRKRFSRLLYAKILPMGGAVSINGVTLKTQVVTSSILTSFMLMLSKSETVLESSAFQFKETAMLVVEESNMASGTKLRAHTDNYLQLMHGVDFHSVQNNHDSERRRGWYGTHSEQFCERDDGRILGCVVTWTFCKTAWNMRSSSVLRTQFLSKFQKTSSASSELSKIPSELVGTRSFLTIFGLFKM